MNLNPDCPGAVPRLLVVDDQPINARMIHRIFHDSHEVFVATGGKQALDSCRDNPLPDLILLDVIMPGMDGLETCRRLKADPATRDIPVIFVTAQSDPLDETRALEAGGVDFISKPINPAVVKARVKTHLTLKAQSDLLRSLAVIDGLTGIANRRRFDEVIEAEWRRCRRSSSPLTSLMVDIDYFKLFNDHYGHQSGDACLRRVAMTIKACFSRSHDLVARYGGEEFVCLMPECDLAAGQAKAEELRTAMERLAIPHATAPNTDHVTLSIGIASVFPNDAGGSESLIAAADAALYEAKRRGRDRAVPASASDAARSPR